jgi:hypothetical protein
MLTFMSVNAMAQDIKPCANRKTPAETNIYEGYVLSYTVAFNTSTQGKDGLYFSARLSSQKTSDSNSNDFVLARNRTLEADKAGESYWVVNWATLSAIAVSTIQDAAISGRKVRIVATCAPITPGMFIPTMPWHLFIRSVTLTNE